jgi:hypothetical protein
MTDDDRPEGAAGPPILDTTPTEIDDEVVLPEHASAYYSPRMPPAATEHRTIETDAVRLDPSIDVQLAETRRISTEALSPTLWFTAPPSSDTPVALVATRGRGGFGTRLAVGAIWSLVLVLGGVYWMQTGTSDRQIAVSATASNPTPALTSPVVTAAPRAAGAPPIAASASSAPEGVPAVAPPPGTDAARLAVNEVTSAPKIRRPVPSSPRVESARGASAPAPGFGPGMPKAWIK